MFVMMFSYGTLISYIPNIDQKLSRLGFEDSGRATSEIILSAMVAGIISSFFFIRKIKSTLQYRAIIAICK